MEGYENDRDPDRYKSNEDNYRAVSERRKPTSGRENESRMEEQMAGMNIDDDRNAERRNDNDDDDDDEKSEEASVERDANGINGETDA